MTNLISTNPARGYEEVGTVRLSTEEEIKKAVSDAKGAFPLWRVLSLQERRECFERFLDIFTT